MVDVAVAWAAGLFEGEGNAILMKTGDIPRLQLQMTDEDVVRKFHSIVGRGTVRGPFRKENRKDSWYWRVAGIKPVFEILTELYPYLGSRRQRQAADVIAGYYLADRKRR